MYCYCNLDSNMLLNSDCHLFWQISPGSSSPHLSNNKLFPLFLRTVSSDAEIAVGITAAMKKFGWSRVALITQSESIFTFVSLVTTTVYTSVYMWTYFITCSVFSYVYHEILHLYGYDERVQKGNCKPRCKQVLQ